MTPTRIACTNCEKFTLHVTASYFIDNERNENGITELIDIHCDSCSHDFTLQIG
jgi:hypothetical protein